MRRIPGPIAAIPALALSLSAIQARAFDHVVLSEFAVRPTDAEFVEIYNPTDSVVDLSDYYLSDYVLGDVITNYWRLVDGALLPDPAFPNDFLARFPDGTTIAPGQAIVVSLHDDAAFASAWSFTGETFVPDFELVDDGTSDGVPAMIDPGPASNGQNYIQPEAGLSNAREVIVLFRWDGVSDLVEDVDIVQWGDAGPDFFTLSPNKTGVSVDGPDPGTSRTMYRPDTPPAMQHLAFLGAHDFDLTVTRIDYLEGAETRSGGNGLTGHDETSEDYSNTWLGDTEPSIGSPGTQGPPSLVSAVAISRDQVDIGFSRAMDPATSEDAANYTARQVLSPSQEPVDEPLAVLSARLLPDGATVRLTTGTQVPVALYEVLPTNLLTADSTLSIVPGQVIRFRGFNDAPDVSLTVPGRPFVPDLEGEFRILYVAPQGMGVLLRVFDMEGRELFVLAEETAPAGGLGTVLWDGRDHLRQRLPAGVYVLHLELLSSGEEAVAPLVIAAAPGGTLRKA
ncbi:MAG TPA: lamin tail domain-containing protein, partial [bacterium]|nr:lamin tail domain-containing protein [bacterium]